MRYDISAVVPAFNEAPCIANLHDRFRQGIVGLAVEVIVVDDGSTDATSAEIRKYASLRYVGIPRSGKSAALRRGIEAASAEFVVMIDADLQEDPAQIPEFIEQLRAGADLVIGVRLERADGFWTKRLPSQAYNWFVRMLFATEFRDLNCGFRAARRDLLLQLRWFDGCHRLLPLMVARRGGIVREIPVRHVRRRFGRPKYDSPRRFLPALWDVLKLRLGIVA